MESMGDENYNRHDALGFAVQYYKNRNGNPEDVTETAELFYSWLTNYREDV